MIAFKGVRSSWLMAARNSDLARSAASAWSRAMSMAPSASSRAASSSDSSTVRSSTRRSSVPYASPRAACECRSSSTMRLKATARSPISSDRSTGTFASYSPRPTRRANSASAVIGWANWPEIRTLRNIPKTESTTATTAMVRMWFAMPRSLIPSRVLCTAVMSPAIASRDRPIRTPPTRCEPIVIGAETWRMLSAVRETTSPVASVLRVRSSSRRVPYDSRVPDPS